MRHNLLLLTLLLVAPHSSEAAGPYGHFILARRTITGITSGGQAAPPELRQALEDPECQRAFAGGAVGPDIAEGKTHYGNTAELARQLLSTANNHLQSAQQAGDAERVRAARIELSFAYGWMSHVSDDLNIHPQVNAFAGDAYSYNNKGEKTRHAAQEAQLAAYLQRTLLRPGEKYDVRVPYSLLASVLSVDEHVLKRGLAKLNGKAAAEIAAAGKVHLSAEQLAAIWRDVVRAAHADTLSFINNTGSVENWDLDAGRISTEEFRELHELVMELNGGKLPAGWARSYLEWFRQLRGLSREQRRAKLAELLGVAPPPSQAPNTTTSGFSPPSIMSGPSELQRTKHVRIEIPRYVRVVGGQGPTRYVSGLILPNDFTLPTTVTPILWSGQTFTQQVNVRQGDDDISMQVSGRVSTDGSMLERLQISFSRTQPATSAELEVKDIPLNHRLVGTVREGDVQFAVWNAAEAPAHITRLSGTLFDGSFQAIEWDKPTNEHKPTIYVKFYAIPW